MINELYTVQHFYYSYYFEEKSV